MNSLGFCPALLINTYKRRNPEYHYSRVTVAFLAFFAGSSVWFLPLPLAGKARKREVLKTIGILATGLAGIIFMIKGINQFNRRN